VSSNLCENIRSTRTYTPIHKLATKCNAQPVQSSNNGCSQKKMDQTSDKKARSTSIVFPINMPNNHYSSLYNLTNHTQLSDFNSYRIHPTQTLRRNVPGLLEKFSATILPANNCSPSTQVENKCNTVYIENTINKKGTQKSNISSTSHAVHSKNTNLLGSLNDTYSNINDRDQYIITNATQSAPVQTARNGRSKKKIVPTSDEPAIKSSTFAQVGTKCIAKYTENGINCKINKERAQNSNIV